MTAQDLRSKLLKYNPFRSRLVEVNVPQEDGTTTVLSVKVKQPTVEERQAIFAEAKVSRDGTVNAAQSRTGALAIIYCVRDPDTDEAVFNIADLDTIMHSPAGGWFDVLAGKVMEVLVEAQDLAKK